MLFVLQAARRQWRGCVYVEVDSQSVVLIKVFVFCLLVNFLLWLRVPLSKELKFGIDLVF